MLCLLERLVLVFCMFISYLYYGCFKCLNDVLVLNPYLPDRPTYVIAYFYLNVNMIFLYYILTMYDTESILVLLFNHELLFFGKLSIKFDSYIEFCILYMFEYLYIC